MFKDLLHNWHTLVALIVAVYEVIVRFIPTVGNYSLIGKLVLILKFIVDNIASFSDYLNNKKK